MRRTIALLIGLFCAPLASGQSPDELRPWTDASGRYRIQARFVRVVGDYVELIKSDGRTIALPIGRLSTRDKEFAVANSRPIDAALNSKIQFQFAGGTLRDALDTISQASQVRFLIDRERLTQEGKTVPQNVASANLDGTVAKILDQLLSAHGLAWAADRYVVFVTTPSRKRTFAIPRVYRITNQSVDAQDMVTRINQTLMQQKDSVARALTRKIVVRATWDLHQQIQDDHRDQLQLVPFAAWNASTPTEEALKRPVDLNVQNTPMNVVAEILSEMVQFNVKIDQKAFHTCGLSIEFPVTSVIDGVPLESMLRYVMLPRVDWQIDGGVIQWTYRDFPKVTTQTYRVTDFDMPNTAATHDQAITSRQETSIGNLLTQTIDPDSWVSRGGEGEVKVDSGNVTVLQTGPLHWQIRQLIADLN